MEVRAVTIEEANKLFPRRFLAVVFDRQLSEEEKAEAAQCIERLRDLGGYTPIPTGGSQ